jgi:hypothetical protein
MLFQDIAATSSLPHLSTVLRAYFAGTLDNLCHSLLVMGLPSPYGALDCHAAALQLSQLKACLPHLKSIVASITALGKAWARAANLPGSVPSSTLKDGSAQDASPQEHTHSALPQTGTITGALHGYAGLSTSTCTAYHCSCLQSLSNHCSHGLSMLLCPHLCLCC